MPGGWQLDPGICNLTDEGTSLSTSLGTVITASSTINTKGSYAQLVALTPVDAEGFLLQLSKPSSTTGGYLIDIAVGASGSELVILPNVVFNNQSSSFSSMTIWVPLAIPAGSRIAARSQSSTASGTITCNVILAEAWFDEDQCLSNAMNFGASTSSSFGVTIDPGASADTKGAYTQLIASTSFDVAAIQIIFDNQGGAAAAAASILVGIAVGASGSEKVIVPNLMATTAGTGQIAEPAPPDIPIRIPAGSRIAVRGQSTNTNSSTRKFGCSIIGYGA